jgi:N-acetylated-alpha-linked acidic dipeptidase
MTAPVRFRASLREPPLDGDGSTELPNQLPTFNAYSGEGDVTAGLVYVNYGLPEDYAYLAANKIDVSGKVVIARYGRAWRGLKARLAQDNGAVACLLYSDPRDDGYFVDDTYPKGGMRPADGVQRGSVMDMSVYPGDPLTPGAPSEPGARRLSRPAARTILRIPVLPISWADAQPLLAQLGGPVAPEPWRGALPLTYHLGPGPAEVRVRANFDWSIRPLYNVIATIPGGVYRDQWVLYGNHHDAWVTGASDPISGASALMETARVLSVLVKQGWQPRRTIKLALWDGEEFGLIGSTEWVEKHAADLDRSAAVYLNTDSSGTGAFGAGGSHSLEPFLLEVMRDVSDPREKKSLLEAARTPPPPPPGAQPAEPPAEREFRLGSLGAGSDYVAFLHHAGIASMHLGFGAESGQYHSIYDTIAWFEKFSDGDRRFGLALAQTTTTALLRLADAPVLPLEFAALAGTIRRYIDEIRGLLPRTGSRLDLTDVAAQTARLDAAARLYEAALAAAMRRAAPIPPENLREVNQALQRTERALLLNGGLPGRDWYRHSLYAPGLFTGYAAKTLPGVREAVEARQWDVAGRQARSLAQSLRAAADQVEQAARLLRAASR